MGLRNYYQKSTEIHFYRLIKAMSNGWTDV